MKDTRTVDLIMGILFLLLGIGVIINSRSMPTATYGLGAGGYPLVVGILLTLMGAMLSVQTLTKLKGGLPKLSLPKDRHGFMRIVILTALTFGYIGILPVIGFLLLTPIYLFVGMMLFGYRKYITAAIVSLGISTAIFFLFTRVFLIFLPEMRLF